MKKLKLFFWGIIFAQSALGASNAGRMLDSARAYKGKDYRKVIYFAGSSYNLARKSSDSASAAESAYLLGYGNYLSGNYDNALSWYIQAERLFGETRVSKGLIDLYADMCVFYLKTKKPEEASLVIDKAISLSKRTDDLARLATGLNNKGLVYLDEHKMDSAAREFSQAYQLYKSKGNRLGMAYSLDYLSSAHAELGKTGLALSELKQSSTLRDGIGDKTGEAISINNIGELYLKDGKPGAAQPYFEKAIAQAHDLHFQDLEIYALKMLTDVLGKQGHYKEALKSEGKYIALSERFLDEKHVKAIEELQTRYQTTKKTQMIKLLHEENTIQHLEIGRKTTLVVIIAALFLLSAVIAYLYYRWYKLRQKGLLQMEVIRQQELAARGIIAAEENERKRLAEELHDGVGQLFTTVRMNLEILWERYLAHVPAASELAGKTMAIVDESCIEVRSIAHQMMPSALQKQGLAQALNDFILKIPHEKLKINLETAGIETGLGRTVEAVLYRIIQECVNNVLKHASAKNLDIVLLSDSGEITVTIEDDGVGFETQDRSEGIGLKNMRSRVEFLKGTIEISSRPGHGTLVAVYLPASLNSELQ